MQERICGRYFRRRFAGGRRLIGRVLDFLALRAVILLSCRLLFRARIDAVWVQWLLAAISVAACSLLIRIVRECLFARFVRRERQRLFDAILLRNLMLLPPGEFLRLCDTVLEFGRIPCPLQCAEPADRDAILRFARAGEGRPITVFSTSGYTKEAEAFVQTSGLDIRLTPVQTLLAAALRSRACPKDGDVAREICRMESAARRKRKRAAAEPFANVPRSKYLIAAAILTGASFFTAYPLYCRLLAGLCMLLALGSAVLRRQKQA